ncbi:Tn3 family transposase [Streptomyces sp. NPDC059991]|uniref:Tn3 family transposase n=1 Tax=Streptomyces sp. NPDC059991 TaxID=3347028 RepID=UPI0036824C26
MPAPRGTTIAVPGPGSTSARIRMFGREGHLTPLGAAFAEYTRIDKTMHLPALVDPVDDTYRRLMNRQLTVQEFRDRLARAICHGGRGQIARRTGRAWRTSSPLGLVLNAVVLWNTRHLDAATAQLRAEGHDIKGEDVARLSRRSGPRRATPSWAQHWLNDLAEP